MTDISPLVFGSTLSKSCGIPASSVDWLFPTPQLLNFILDVFSPTRSGSHICQAPFLNLQVRVFDESDGITNMHIRLSIIYGSA